MPGQHFVIGAFRSHAEHLPDDAYARVLDSLVIATVDVLLMAPGGEIFLDKRTAEPAQGKFETPGGRMRPGESFAETASRIVGLELGVTVAPHRFRYLGTNSFAWARRAQLPQDHGCHTVSTAMVAELTDEEAAEIRSGEDPQSMWISPEEIVARASEFEGAVAVQVCRDYLASKSVS